MAIFTATDAVFSSADGQISYSSSFFGDCLSDGDCELFGGDE